MPFTLPKRDSVHCAHKWALEKFLPWPRFEPGVSGREALIIHLPCHLHESNGQRYLVVGVLRLHRDGEEVGMVRDQPAEKSGDFTGLVFGLGSSLDEEKNQSAGPAEISRNNIFVKRPEMT